MHLDEAVFLTVNVKNIFNKASNSPSIEKKLEPTSNSPETTTSTNTSTEESPTNSKILDWGAELEKRLTNNKKMHPEARETEFEIEKKFFDEFFLSEWKTPEMVKILQNLGSPLKKAFKVLGFDKQTNPIYGFLAQDYVQKKLLIPKYINANTFKAIYNAVAKNSVADHEFFKTNDYNIIYCQDLYTKSVKEIEEYLKQQEMILSPTVGNYDDRTKNKNKQIFIYIKQAAEEPDIEKRGEQIKKYLIKTSICEDFIKLNDLAFIEQLLKLFNYSENFDEISLDEDSQKALIQKIESRPQIKAMLMYLAKTSDSEEAKKALKIKAIDIISDDRVVRAQKQIAEFLPKGQIIKKDADNLVKALLDLWEQK